MNDTTTEKFLNQTITMADLLDYFGFVPQMATEASHGFIRIKDYDADTWVSFQPDMTPKELLNQEIVKRRKEAFKDGQNDIRSKFKNLMAFQR